TVICVARSGGRATAVRNSSLAVSSSDLYIGGLAAGTYTVSASLTGYTMSAPQTVTLGPDKTGVNFTAAASSATPTFLKGVNLGEIGRASCRDRSETAGGKTALTKNNRGD